MLPVENSVAMNRQLKMVSKFGPIRLCKSFSNLKSLRRTRFAFIYFENCRGFVGGVLYFRKDFGATRRAGFLPINFIRKTELSATPNVFASHETAPFGQVLLVAALLSVNVACPLDFIFYYGATIGGKTISFMSFNSSITGCFSFNAFPIAMQCRSSSVGKRLE